MRIGGNTNPTGKVELYFVSVGGEKFKRSTFRQ